MQYDQLSLQQLSFMFSIYERVVSFREAAGLVVVVVVDQCGNKVLKFFATRCLDRAEQLIYPVCKKRRLS